MHFTSSQLPSGNDAIKHGISTPTLHENLLAQMLTPTNLDLAYKRVKANKGSAGIDGKMGSD